MINVLITTTCVNSSFSLKGTVCHFGKYTYSISCQDLDEKNICEFSTEPASVKLTYCNEQVVFCLFNPYTQKYINISLWVYGKLRAVTVSLRTVLLCRVSAGVRVTIRLWESLNLAVVYRERVAMSFFPHFCLCMLSQANWLLALAPSMTFKLQINVILNTPSTGVLT